MDRRARDLLLEPGVAGVVVAVAVGFSLVRFVEAVAMQLVNVTVVRPGFTPQGRFHGTLLVVGDRVLDLAPIVATGLTLLVVAGIGVLVLRRTAPRT